MKTGRASYHTAREYARRDSLEKAALKLRGGAEVDFRSVLADLIEEVRYIGDLMGDTALSPAITSLGVETTHAMNEQRVAMEQHPPSKR
jgi:hypothetical protein